MKDWHDVPCTCGVSRNGIKGAHHSTECERMIARKTQHEALLATVAVKREKRRKKAS